MSPAFLQVSGTGYWAPNSVSGLRFSASGLDEGRGKVPSPFPHPCTAEGRIPSPDPGDRARYLGPDTRCRIDAEGRVPSTEDRARPPENAHTGYAWCVIEMARIPVTWYLAPMPHFPPRSKCVAFTAYRMPSPGCKPAGNLRRGAEVRETRPQPSVFGIGSQMPRTDIRYPVPGTGYPGRGLRLTTGGA